MPGLEGAPDVLKPLEGAVEQASELPEKAQELMHKLGDLGNLTEGNDMLGGDIMGMMGKIQELDPGSQIAEKAKVLLEKNPSITIPKGIAEKVTGSAKKSLGL